MKNQTVKVSFSREAAAYEIVFDGSLAKCGSFARRWLGKDAAKIVIVSNPVVYKVYGGTVEASLAKAGFAVSHWLMKDGEQHKDLRNAQELLRSLSDLGVTRSDAVVALGGGVVGDLAGFAASIYMRGIRFLQVPTTLLAMIDSSVGGKTGVNASFGKNTIGTFHQPSGVLIDPMVLATLPKRELAAGSCEVIKHGVLSGRGLFTQTAEFLKKFPPEDFAAIRFKGSSATENSGLRAELSDLIRRNVEFKASIVAGDERESLKRSDSRSRKILNLGHTLAHALEKTTDYKYFKHGEAVGYGILYAAELSKNLALCDAKVVNLLYDVVHSVGTLPSLANIDSQQVFEAFRFDKKHVAGSLQLILLRGIGRPLVVSNSEIPKSAHTKALRQLFKF